MMEKFLVKGQISKRGYMQENVETIDDMAFVYANDEDDAESLFKKHWKDKTEEHSVYYSVRWCECVRTINNE